MVGPDLKNKADFPSIRLVKSSMKANTPCFKKPHFLFKTGENSSISVVCFVC